MTSVDRYGIYVSQMTYAPFVEFATRGTRRVSHVEQEMYTLSEHMCSTPGFSRVRGARFFSFLCSVL